MTCNDQVFPKSVIVLVSEASNAWRLGSFRTELLAFLVEPNAITSLRHWFDLSPPPNEPTAVLDAYARVKP